MDEELIEKYGLQEVRDSWSMVCQKLDVYTGLTDLINLLEAAMEQGKRLGRVPYRTALKVSVEPSWSATERATVA
jgi:hypothetical protein